MLRKQISKSTYQQEQNPFIGHEPACGMSDIAAKWSQGVQEALRVVESTRGQIHTNSFLSKLSATVTVGFLNLNTSQTRQVTGL